MSLAELTARFAVLAKSKDGKKGGGKSKDPGATIKSMDTDGDSLLTREEWKGQAEAYDQIDTNRDAHVTLDELTTHLAALANSEGGKKVAESPKTLKQ